MKFERYINAHIFNAYISKIRFESTERNTNLKIKFDLDKRACLFSICKNFWITSLLRCIYSVSWLTVFYLFVQSPEF